MFNPADVVGAPEAEALPPRGGRIELQGIEKWFGRTHVLKGIDLEVRAGEFCVFVGPSGCGKSTLLRVVAGLEEPTAGTLRIDGASMADVAPSDRGAAMVFQSYALYPHMTVYENMAFGLQLKRTKRAEIDARVRAAARALQLDELLERLPKQLSGGQRQRVAIGRAITRQPKLFLFDEPLSNLDAALRVQMRIELSNLHQRLGSTMIYVTHDQTEAMTLADRIVILNGGQIVQVGAPLELYHRPSCLFTAGFIGSPRMNFLEARVVASAEPGVLVEVSGGERIRVAAKAGRLAPGEAAILGIRPEHVRLAAARPAVNGLAMEVRVLEHLGDVLIAYGDRITTEGTPFALKQQGGARLARGETVQCELPANACLLFEPGTGLALAPSPPGSSC
jgi:multiple sugar transport system ATP-binding protein